MMGQRESDFFKRLHINVKLSGKQFGQMVSIQMIVVEELVDLSLSFRAFSQSSFHQQPQSYWFSALRDPREVFCLCTLSLYILLYCHCSHAALEVEEVNSREHSVPDSSSRYDNLLLWGPADGDHWALLWGRVPWRTRIELGVLSSMAAAKAGGCSPMLTSVKGVRSQCSSEGDVCCCREQCKAPGSCQGGKRLGWKVISWI